MNNIVVTTGFPFTDIDALACTLAYCELLNLEGVNTESVLPGPLNNSITQNIRSWKLKYSKKPSIKSAIFVLTDISDPEFFAKFVDIEKVIEIYDHRFGFGDYWRKKLGGNSHIEIVGSCATLIWEQFVKREKQNKISLTSANLLQTAIVSNTLNFKASVTTNRDKKAFNELKKYTDLPKNWVESYFEELERGTFENLRKTIINDTKDLKPYIAQLELWNSKKIINEKLQEIDEIMTKTYKTDNWFLTSPSISEGKNYLFTKNPKIKKTLTQKIGAEFVGNVGTTKKLWLRKEVWKKMN